MRGIEISRSIPWQCLVRAIFLTLVFLIVQTCSVQAQEAADPGVLEVATDSTVSADTTRYTATTAVLRLDKLTGELRQLLSEMEVGPEIVELSNKLPFHLQEVDTLVQMYDALPEFRLSLRDLDNINRIWARLDGQTKSWGETLYARLEDMQVKREWVAEKRESWARFNLTADSLEIRLVQDRMARLQLDVDSLDMRVRSRLEVLIGLSDSLNIGEESLLEVGSLLKQRVVDTRIDLFVREGPILPMTFFRNDADIAFKPQFARSTSRDWQALDAYYKLGPVRFVVPVISLFIFLIVALLVRHRSKSWDRSQETLKGIVDVASKPLATALLLALIVMALLFQKPPPVLSDAVRLLAIYPLVRLLPGMMSARFRLPLYAFFGLILFHSSNVLVRIGSPFEGFIVFLSGSGLAALLGYSLFRTAGLKRLKKGILWTGAWHLSYLLFFVVVAGVIAVFLGYRALGDVLVDNGFRAIFSALALFAANQILNGAWSLFLGSGTARRLNAIRLHATLIYKRGVFLMRAFFVLWWLQILLVLFGVMEIVAEWTVGIILKPIKFAALTVNIGSILAFFFTIFFAVLVSRLVRFLLQTDVFPKFSMARGMSSAILTLTNYAILTLGLLAAISAAGVDFQSLAFLVGGLGIGIGFGLQGIVNNFLSGLILIFERPIRVGDTIVAGSPGGQIMAVVRRIGIRSSIIRTFEGAEVIMPNANLISNDVVNWTKTDQLRRIEIEVGVEYGSDPERVIELLTGVANDYPELLKRPEAYTLFIGYGENSLDFSLRAWVADFDKYLGVRSEFTLRVHRALTDAGIRVPFPQRDIHLRTDFTEKDARVDQVD